MNALPTSLRPTEFDHLAGVIRVIRRICLLREQDAVAESVRLEKTELADAVRDVRLALGPAALPESELRAMFAAEERRVAEVAILAELLIPQLRESFPIVTGPVRREAAVLAPRVAASAPSRPAAAGSPAIPDLLDAMLAADRAGNATGTESRRRQPAA